jgi:Family of unknown function (DUF6152)
MRRELFISMVVTCAMAGLVSPVLAHHSFAAEFDATKPVQMEGVVTKVEWMNPHVYFYVDVTDTTGKVVNWACEMGGPNALQRQGWNRNTLKIGMKVAFEGTLAKDGTPKTNARNVTVEGKRLGAASSEGVNP